MSIEFYIGRDSDGTERSFPKTFERVAAMHLAKAMHRKYHDTPRHYALIANIASPPIDMIILTSDGIGIIDFKDYSASLYGAFDTPWYFLTSEGKIDKAVNSGSHLNPFMQLKEYRKGVRGKLRSFSKMTSGIPSWLAAQPAPYIQTAMVLTAHRPNCQDNIQNNPKSKRWFTFKNLHEVPEWAMTLAFGQNRRLTDEQIHRVATELFKTTEWKEIKPHLSNQKPFAFLREMSNGKENNNFISLRHEMITLGRGIQIDHTFDSVSRRHAIIRKTVFEVVLEDDSSTNGTWVNGQKLEKTHVLEEGDLIILGKIVNGKPAPNACMYRYVIAQDEAGPTIKG